MKKTIAILAITIASSLAACGGSAQTVNDKPCKEIDPVTEIDQVSDEKFQECMSEELGVGR